MFKDIKIIPFIGLAMLCVTITSGYVARKNATGAETDLSWTKKVGARQSPNKTTVFIVNDYGATNDGKAVTTQAIQQAIDACAANGGGIVSFQPGVYLTGAIFLKSNVHLQIDKGVAIKGSQNFEDYPEINTRIAGIEMKWPAALINIIDQQNTEVSGEGTVDAQGKFCWDKYWAMRKEYEPKGLRWVVDYDAKRVRTFLIQSSSDVTLKGITFKNAGFWTVQILYSTYVTVDSVVIRNNEDGHGPSTDGVDIDSSSWILVQNCDIDCNDDDFCLKAGRDWDGLRVNRPTEYVLIRKCIARKGGGLLTLGSETSGGIRHVLATDINAKGTSNGFQIKSATTRGGTVEDIHFQNATMDSVGNAFLFTMNWNPSYSYSTLPAGYNYDSIPEHWKKLLHKVEPPEKGIPHFKDIYVNNVQVNWAKTAINAAGIEGSFLEDFNFSHIQMQASTAGKIEYGKDWRFDNVSINAKDNSTMSVTNSIAMQLH